MWRLLALVLGCLTLPLGRAWGLETQSAVNVAELASWYLPRTHVAREGEAFSRPEGQQLSYTARW